MKKLLILLMLLVLPLVFAEEITTYIKTDTQGTVQFACYNSTQGICVPSTTCNISITDPNGDKIVDNKQTTRSSDIYVYNITPTEVGNYKAYVYCYGSDTGYTNFLFQSNNQGKELTNFGAILSIFGIITAILVIFLIILIIRGSVWMYPILILCSLCLLVFMYVWWSYSLNFTGILFAVYKITTWLCYAAILFSLFELMIAYWNFLSRRKKSKEAYGDQY
jgi:hypothetical protein